MNLTLRLAVLAVASTTIARTAAAQVNTAPIALPGQDDKVPGVDQSAPPPAKKATHANPENDGTSPPLLYPVTLGLSPGAPQTASLPGGMTPAFGSMPIRADDWRFDFHGFVTLPLRMGINKRPNPLVGQKISVLHGPPVVADDFESFDYKAIVPNPWVQLNFTYGNRDVTATVIVAARAVANAVGYLNPPDQMGINDAFLTFRLPRRKGFEGTIDLGAASNRYGVMGEYDVGHYGTPIIARLGGIGATGNFRFDLDPNFRLYLEGGFMGQLNKAPVGVEPAGWNGFVNSNVGSSFAGHAHAGVEIAKLATVGLHYIYTFVQDDRASTQTLPDGHISIYGGDLRLSMGPAGHFYAATSLTDAKSAARVSSVLRVLNAPGGQGLEDEYFGPDTNAQREGTGKLITAGAEYNLSLGTLLRRPHVFNGRGPDLLLSAFGILAHVDSPVTGYDNVNKLKYGGEITYSALSWLGIGGRYDNVRMNLKDATQTHAVLSARVILHSDYQSHDQVVIQYSGWLNGSGTVVRDGYPPKPDPATVPDSHVISIAGTMWW